MVISGSVKVELDLQKCFEQFKYNFNLDKLKSFLYRLKSNEYAFLGDSIVRLAAVCFQLQNLRALNELDYEDFCRNQNMASFMREHKLFIPVSGTINDHSFATIYETIICAIFLFGNNRDRGLINALDACIFTTKSLSLDLDADSITQHSISPNIIYPYLGDAIANVYYRYSLIPKITEARKLSNNAVARCMQIAGSADSRYNFVKSYGISYTELGKHFIESDTPSIIRLFE